MNLAYTAYDTAGTKRTGVTTANSLAEAREHLRGEGLFVKSIEEVADQATGADAKNSATIGRNGGGARVKLLSLFARELSLLVSSGTPLVDALQAVERQTADESWRAVIGDVRKGVEEGAALSEALAVHPRVFDPVVISMVAAGEAGGNLAEMLDRLSHLVRQQLKVRNNVVGAMVYPAVLMGVSACVLVAMIVAVLPRFAEMFESLDAELPATTAALLGVSSFLRAWWWGLVPGLVGAVVGSVLWSRTPGGRWSLSSMILRTPQVGAIARALSTARVARVLGVLLDSRVPMLEALTLTRRAMPNPHYARMLEHAESAVVSGEPVSASFERHDLINPSVIEAMRNGEKSGRLSGVLLGVADYLDEDNEVLVRSLSSIVEPIILIIMGVLVAFVALSMFLPLFDLTASASGGAM